MLLSFRLENHRSIYSEQELSLLPVYDKSVSAVPVAAIFGANASGKSNLVDGLRFMWTAVRSSYASWERGTGIPRTPFRLDPDARARPSGYAAELLIDGTGYVYGFSVDDQRVLDEWLWAYPHRRKRVVFERQGQKIEFGSTLAPRRSRADLVAELTRPNALFLSAAAQAEQPDVLPVYDWFRTGLEFPDTSRLGVDGRFAGAIAPDAERRAMVLDLLKAADPGITAVELDLPYVEEVGDGVYNVHDSHGLMELHAPAGLTSGEILAGLGVDEETLRFRHGANRAELSLTEQSAGTRHWMNLLGAVLYALEKGSVVCVDEIDSSLHPRLTARLIELFQDERSNPAGAQLIFTTHDATLLSTSFGREVLARDQIWFVEKDDSGATSLFPLSDFRPRKEENTERRYLGGSYGAVPAVFSDTLVEKVLEDREAADATA